MKRVMDSFLLLLLRGFHELNGSFDHYFCPDGAWEFDGLVMADCAARSGKDIPNHQHPDTSSGSIDGRPMDE
jgi:hypothetical protein